MGRNYQDAYFEFDCEECGGAGFFGNGPIVEPCDVCQGRGVLVGEDPRPASRKPPSRESTRTELTTRTEGKV
jgi:hypothetical protein